MAPSHQKRTHENVSAFRSASEAMIAVLERSNDAAATHAPADGAWTAAQIGYHVAITDDFLAGILTGSIPKSVPAPSGFQENPNVFAGVPAKITTFEALEPPAGMTRAEAVAKLRESTAQAVKAIEGLSEDRASGHVVEFPFGKITLYQLSEFLGGHVLRHQQQLQRALASV